MRGRVPTGDRTDSSQDAPVSTRIIVADVGGTYARLGWIDADGGNEIHDYRRYACADHPDLASILHDYAAGTPAMATTAPWHGVPAAQSCRTEARSGRSAQA